MTSLLPFLLFLPLRFPAWVVLPFWVALQWVAAGRADQGPGVAYLAHLVGFGLGFGFAWARFRPATAVSSRGPTPDPRQNNRANWTTSRVRAPAMASEGENQP